MVMQSHSTRLLTKKELGSLEASEASEMSVTTSYCSASVGSGAGAAPKTATRAGIKRRKRILLVVMCGTGVLLGLLKLGEKSEEKSESGWVGEERVTTSYGLWGCQYASREKLKFS